MSMSAASGSDHDLGGLLVAYAVSLDPDPQYGLVAVHRYPDDRAAVQLPSRVGGVSDQPVGSSLGYG